MLHTGHHREGRAEHRAGGEETVSGGSFVYLGGEVYGDGKTERGVRRKVHAEANAWRAVEGVVADRRISKRLGQGHDHFCDTGMPAQNGNFGTDRNTTTKASSVRKQLGTKTSKSKEGRQEKERLSFLVKGIDGRTEELDREPGEEHTTWPGHVERMADDRLPKRVVELREEGRRRRGRSMLRWEDCVKRDARKAGEGEDWKKKTRDRGVWKILSDEAEKLRAAPRNTLTKGK